MGIVTRPPTPLTMQAVLSQTGWLRRLTRRLVVGEDHADEILAETLLVAVQRRGDAVGAVRPWLSRVATNVWHRMHLRDRLRIAGEAERGAAPSSPATDEVVARAEAQRRLTDAVLALAEPYRTAILLRFLEELSYAEVAERAGVPVETVRTRIKRGLRILRQRLDREAGGCRAWALPILGVARFESLGLAATAVGGTGLGSIFVVMSMTKLLAACVALILVVAVWHWWPEERLPGTVVDERRTASRVVERAGKGAASSIAPSTDRRVLEPDLAQVATGDQTVAAARTAVFRGHCVDAGGAALAGVRVRLHGWPGNDQRLNSYRKEHGEIEWTDPGQTLTGADGSFELAFDPPPPYQFAIDIEQGGKVWMTGRWHEIAPGTVKELGNIIMLGGCRVRGLLVDTAGVPLGKARIRVEQHGLARTSEIPEIHHRDHASCVTGLDGSFEFGQMLSAGDWKPGINGEKVVSPKLLVVPGGSDHFVKVVVRSKTGIPTITGMVVDEAGRPVREVTIEARDTPTGYGRSGRDGTFTLRPGRRDTGDPLVLVFRGRGFEPVTTKPAVAWGRHDLRVVLERGLSLRIQVRDANSQQPIEDYAVVVLPAPGQRMRQSARDRGLRGRGMHVEGVFELAGLRRGRYLVLIDPIGKEWMHSGLHRVEIGDGRPNHLVIELHRGVTKVVRVETTAGVPVAGSRLELLQPAGGKPVGFETQMLKLYGGSWSSSADMALFRAAGVTDARGELEFTAPPAGDYVIRAHGPGHRPHIEAGVAFAVAKPELVLLLPVGARVHGKVSPLRLIAQLRELGKTVVQGHKYRVGFRLQRRTVDGRYENYPHDYAERLGLAEDGAFEMSGVPPGRWKVWLHWGLNGRELVGELGGLRDGESRKRDFELSRMILAKLHGRVTLNGKPAIGSVLTLHTRGTEHPRWLNIQLDAEAGYRTTVVPDDYLLTLQCKVGERQRVMLPSKRRLRVTAGDAIERDLAFHSGELRIVVVGPDGKPRRGVKIQAVAPDSEWGTPLPVTDAAGAARMVSQVGRLRLYVWPKRLVAPAARRAFLAEHKGDSLAWRRQRVEVAVVEVVANEQAEVRMVLPASLGY